MSSRGHGTCLKCKQEFFNIDQNPPDCSCCGFQLDGTFAGKKKKAKQSNPAVVEISQSLYSCRSSKVTVASLPVVETHGCVHA